MNLFSGFSVAPIRGEGWHLEKGLDMLHGPQMPTLSSSSSSQRSPCYYLASSVVRETPACQLAGSRYQPAQSLSSPPQLSLIDLLKDTLWVCVGVSVCSYVWCSGGGRGWCNAVIHIGCCVGSSRYVIRKKLLERERASDREPDKWEKRKHPFYCAIDSRRKWCCFVAQMGN